MGLQRAKFPNPGCGGPPFYQACVGFQGGSHTMVKDFTLVWLKRDENSIESLGPHFRAASAEYGGNGNFDPTGRPYGAFCYVDGGTRYKLGTWPSEPPGFRSSPCR